MKSGLIMGRRPRSLFEPSSNNKLLPTSSLSAFCLQALSVCALWSVSHHPPSNPPPSIIHPLSSLFCAFSLFPCLRLVFFPCQRLSKQSRVCVSGLVTRRSSGAASSRRSTAASSFAGRVRHSPDFSLRLRCLFLYSEFDPSAFLERPAWRKREGRGTKLNAWFSGYEQKSGARRKAGKKVLLEKTRFVKPQIAKSEK